MNKYNKYRKESDKLWRLVTHFFIMGRGEVADCCKDLTVYMPWSPAVVNWSRNYHKHNQQDRESVRKEISWRVSVNIFAVKGNKYYILWLCVCNLCYPAYWLACWPLASKFAGSNPAEAVIFFGRKIPQHAFLRRGSKRICPMSQLCGMSKNLVIYMNYGLLAKFQV